MAMFGSLLSRISRVFHPITQECTAQQIRTKYCDARMRRDVKRRKIVKANATMRLRLLSMKRNKILPPEIMDFVRQDMAALSRYSSPQLLTYRCVMTSRPRGNVLRWGLSRFMFRNLVDYNRLAGVQRAMW